MQPRKTNIACNSDTQGYLHIRAWFSTSNDWLQREFSIADTDFVAVTVCCNIMRIHHPPSCPTCENVLYETKVMILVSSKGKEALMCINSGACTSDTFCLVTVVPRNMQTLLHSIQQNMGEDGRKEFN